MNSIIFNKLRASVLVKNFDRFWDNANVFSELLESIGKISYRITTFEDNLSLLFSIPSLLQKPNT